MNPKAIGAAIGAVIVGLTLMIGSFVRSQILTDGKNPLPEGTLLGILIPFMGGFSLCMLGLIFLSDRKYGCSDNKEYRYQYLKFPFDDWQYFSVQAPNPEAADRLARVEFESMFNRRVTVMYEYYRAYQEEDNERGSISGSA